MKELITRIANRAVTSISDTPNIGHGAWLSQVQKMGDRGRYRAVVQGNGYEISIVAGDLNYSTPREYLRNFRDYTAWEVALIIDGKLYDVLDDPRFDNTVTKTLWSGDGLAPYVPTRQVQRIIDETEQILG
jgi:hypothetical protein